MRSGWRVGHRWGSSWRVRGCVGAVVALGALAWAPSALASGNWRYTSSDHTQLQIDFATDNSQPAQYEVFTLGVGVGSATCPGGGAGAVGLPDGSSDEFECHLNPAAASGTVDVMTTEPELCSGTIANKASFDGSTYTAQTDIAPMNNCGGSQPEPDFKLTYQLLTQRVYDEITGVDTYVGLNLVYGLVHVTFDVTNDGHATGTAHVSVPLIDAGKLVALYPDSDPDIGIFSAHFPELLPVQSNNCHLSLTTLAAGPGYTLEPGESAHADCTLASTQPIPPGPATIAPYVTPFDSATDPNRDNDTSVDNRPQATAITVEPSRIALIKLIRAKDIGGDTTIPVMARDVFAPTLEWTAAAVPTVQRVLVAIVRVPHGARAASGSAGCQWVSNVDAKFITRPAVGRECTDPVFLTATGTSHWSLKLRKRLPCGNYVAYAATVDNFGDRTRYFSSQLGDRRAFKVC